MSPTPWANHKWACDLECSTMYWGKGSKVHSFTCPLQSPTEAHHLGYNTFWHTNQFQSSHLFHIPSCPSLPSIVSFVAFLLCCFLGSVPVVADLQWPQLASWGFCEEIPTLWIHWQDLSSSVCSCWLGKSLCHGALNSTSPLLSATQCRSVISTLTVLTMCLYMKTKSFFPSFVLCPCTQ